MSIIFSSLPCTQLWNDNKPFWLSMSTTLLRNPMAYSFYVNIAYKVTESLTTVPLKIIKSDASFADYSVSLVYSYTARQQELAHIAAPAWLTQLDGSFFMNVQPPYTSATNNTAYNCVAAVVGMATPIILRFYTRIYSCHPPPPHNTNTHTHNCK